MTRPLDAPLPPHESPNPTPGVIDRAFVAWAVGVNLLLTVALFGGVLMAGSKTVVSLPGNDVTGYFSFVRTYGFEQLRQTGHLPFWNPRVFSGTPYFANPQAAMLYPPSLVHAFLPPAVAINVFVALHVFLAGAFTSLLARGRGLSRVAAIVAGAAFPLTGGYFMHVYVGHLGFVTFCWTPLILLAVDRLVRCGSARWLVIGALAVAMSVLGNHPQITYSTGLIAGVYLLVQLRSSPHPWRAVGLFATMYALGAGMAGVQLLPILQASKEFVRAGGISYDLATTGSLPPESLLTLAVPRLFGVWHGSPYTGRSLQWEASVYCGTAMFLLAAYGALRPSRNRAPLLILLAVTLVFAFGGFLPTYRLFHRVVPLLDHFRYPGRFRLFADLFLVLLAGQGLDLLLRCAPSRRRAVIGFATAAMVLVAVGLWLSQDAARAPDGTWASFVRTIGNGTEIFVPRETFTDPAIVRRTGAYAANQALWAAVAAGLLAGTVALVNRYPRAVYAVAAVAIIDVFLVARTFNVSGPISQGYPAEWRQAQERLKADERVLTNHLPLANRAMIRGADDVYGYDPLVLRRYAEFLAFTQGTDPARAEMTPTITRASPLFSMLRCRFLLARPQAPVVVEFANPLPHVLLVARSRVLPQRDRQFAAMADPSFNPREQVVLETPADPTPVPADDPGTAGVVRQTADELEIRASVKSPAILLITDAYAPGWTARSLDDVAAQPDYEVLPANYTLRAIPLAAGNHHLVVRYRPPGLVAGLALSVVSTGALIGVAMMIRRRAKTRVVAAAAPVAC
jgi:hypothetical protein